MSTTRAPLMALLAQQNRQNNRQIPLAELLRHDAPILQKKKHSPEPVLKMPLGNDWIAAPTAALAYQFREVALLGKLTRVAHFAQPRFAWS